MLNNSYDASGYHFGIATSTRLQELEDVSGGPIVSLQDRAKIMSILETAEFVDFSNIDGLTMGEITSCYTKESNVILFVMWEAIRIRDMDRDTLMENKNVSYRMVFHSNILNRDMPFDEVVESHLLSFFPQYDQDIEKRAKCFLQRYRYGTKEETDKRLEKIIYIK